jgi:hypothetical protein
METYLQYLVEEHTVFGMTFQYWMPLVAGVILVWIGLVKTNA